MRTRTCFAASTIAVFAIVLNCWTSSSGQEPSTVKITQCSGTVTREGAVLKEGDLVQRGDRISCQGNSEAILTWSNGSVVKLYPETILYMQGVSFETDTKTEKTFLKLEKGRIFAKAQVPEELFETFEVRVNNVPVLTQGSEFLLKYDETAKEFLVCSCIGRVLVDAEMNQIIIEEGQQVTVKMKDKPEGTPVPMPQQMSTALLKTSKSIGGSLLMEEERNSIGGPLSVKIGGIRSRRGKPPYTVKCSALIKGGSGKIKSIHWDFGDGQSAQGKEAQHTFTQGVYGISVSVEDQNGEKATGQIKISVEEGCNC
ncbi:MAG: PKD domain-containing protein [Thermodesulfobacteriota bacterium]